MPRLPGHVPVSLRQLWKRFKSALIADVPEDSAVCEFDCRKNQCLYAEWASCERRISKAAGDLKPPAPPAWEKGSR